MGRLSCSWLSCQASAVTLFKTYEAGRRLESLLRQDSRW